MAETRKNIDEITRTKTDIVDADRFVGRDGSGDYKTLWSSIKDVLKTYFDTIYAISSDILDIASSAEAISGTSDTTLITPLKLRNGFNASGSAPVYACRAWVNFNGTGTVAISGSGNIGALTDSGTGIYTIDFTTAMPDVNFSIVADSQKVAAYASTGMNIAITNSGRFVLTNLENAVSADSPLICASIFR